jgi:hypothetical protein
LYYRYWYPLVDVQSEEQFQKYFSYKDGKITGYSDNAPYGIYSTNHGVRQYFKPGTEFYVLSNEKWTAP